MLGSTDERPPAAARHACRPADRGAYVTDGKRLYRVIGPADPSLGFRDAVLEDCATLAWRIHTVAELWWVPLRAVTPQDER